MNQSCVRCVVTLNLAEVRSALVSLLAGCTATDFNPQLDWRDEKGVDVYLEGPPLFIRGRVLGQMQHSHLQKPYFPISFNQSLTFDRVSPLLYLHVHDSASKKVAMATVIP